MWTTSVSSALRLGLLVSTLTSSLAFSIPRDVELTKRAPAPFSTFNNNTVFQPPSDYTSPGTLYARTLQLPDGSFLATWENYSPEPPPVYFPIFHSTDGGASWSEISRVQDTAQGYGLRYQPFLYLLPEPFAGLPKNTVLLAGSSIPTDLSSTQIDLYASLDSGKTWKFMSHIAHGGEAIPDNGLTPVWEPFLLLLNNELICFYSDQRDPNYGQKLVHQTTTDLKTWSDPVNDVRYPTYTDRPGMTTVTYVPPLNKWMMTYEFGGGPVAGNTTGNYSFPVFYRMSDDPRTFDSAEGLPIVVGDHVPVSSPYITWANVGGHLGSIFVSCGTCTEVYVNTAGGDVNKWQIMQTGEKVSYTRSLRVFEEQGRTRLMIAGGGSLPPATGNRVTVGVVDIGPASGSGW